MTWKRYAQIAADTAIAFATYYFFGWIGFALWTFFTLSCFAVQLIGYQRTAMQTLLSRLPDRCALCHREIVDEGGVLEEESLYHTACIDKLEGLENLRTEAGVPAAEAIHRPAVRRKDGELSGKE